MSSTREYNNSTVGSRPCSYSDLNRYYANDNMMVPVRNFIPGSIVPNFGSVGYNVLTGGPGVQPSCSGYFNITNAYGAECANGLGAQYSLRPCNQQQNNYY